jgi:hypothetical protein
MQCPHNAFKVAVEGFKEKRREREREREKNLANKVHWTHLLMLCRVSLTLSFPAITFYS